jgi:hypothetical protein
MKLFGRLCWPIMRCVPVSLPTPAAMAVASAAKTTFDAALAAYRSGVGSITDATMAETQLLQARNASTDAYSTALSAAAALALATGSLGAPLLSSGSTVVPNQSIFLIRTRRTARRANISFTEQKGTGSVLGRIIRARRMGCARRSRTRSTRTCSPLSRPSTRVRHGRETGRLRLTPASVALFRGDTPEKTGTWIRTRINGVRVRDCRSLRGRKRDQCHSREGLFLVSQFHWHLKTLTASCKIWSSAR